jgi:hypothetical protein
MLLPLCGSGARASLTGRVRRTPWRILGEFVRRRSSARASAKAISCVQLVGLSRRGGLSARHAVGRYRLGELLGRRLLLASAESRTSPPRIFQGVWWSVCVADRDDRWSPARKKVCHHGAGNCTRQTGSADQDRSGRSGRGLSHAQREDEVRGVDGLQGIQIPDVGRD